MLSAIQWRKRPRARNARSKTGSHELIENTGSRGAERYNRPMTYLHRRASLSIVVVASLSLAGCGSSAKKGAPANIDEYLDRFLTELCTIDVACGSMPDMATCLVSFQFETTDLLTVKADIAAGKTRYDAAKAGACLDYAHRLYSSGCTQSGMADISGNDVCGFVVVGTVANGGACFLSSECASANCQQADTACLPAHQCCAGTCVATPAPIPVGADCSALLPHQECAAGSYCFATAGSPTPTCVVPLKVAGAPCSSLYECASPLFCDADPTTGTGTCQRVAATGAACNSDVPFGSCDDLREICSTATGKCTPRGSVGAACDPLQVLSCLSYAQCINSTCVPRSSERGACNPAGGPECLGDLECSTTTNTCGFPANAPACM